MGNDNLLNHPNKHKQTLQEGNACASCSKKLPFNQQTRGWEEMCDECQQKYDNTEIDKNRLQLQSHNRLLQEGNACASCSKKLPFNERTQGWEEMCDECHQKHDNTKPVKDELELQLLNQIVQEGSNCASFSKQVPFNEQNFGFEEMCDECQHRSDHTEPVKKLCNGKEDSLPLNPNELHKDSIKSSTKKCQDWRCSIL